MENINTYYGTTSNGESIYENKSEFSMLRSSYLFKEWFKSIKLEKPSYTLEDYHQLIHNNREVFNKYTKNMCWSDSFMFDTVNFKTGGARRFVDYPDIEIPEPYQPINIEGVQHIIVNYGLLTFDTAPYDDETSVEDIQDMTG